MKKLIAALLLLAVIACPMLTMAACNNTEAEGVKVIDIPLTDELYAFGVKKGDAELLTAVNDFLAEIKANGTFDAVVNKYFGDGTPTAVSSAEEDSSKDQLIVATNAAFAPFEYKEGESYYGVDMELMSLLAAKLNKELVIKNMEFSSVCTVVGNGQCDVAAAGLTVREDRKEILDFSESYYNASQMIIVKESDTTFDDCKTAADVEAKLKAYPNGTKMGAQNGTTGFLYITGDVDFEFEGYSNVEVKGYSNGSLAVQDMLNGNISCVVIDEAPAKQITASFNAAK